MEDGRIIWVEGRALSYGESASYMVARDVLRNLLVLGLEVSSIEAGLTLHAAIEQLLPEQAADIYPYLAYLLEITLDNESAQRIKYLEGEALHQQILQAVRSYILACTQQAPVVIVWEDLHWADPSSLRLLETLLTPARSGALLHLLIYRRPVRDSRIWEFQQKLNDSMKEAHLTIELSPLTPAESGQLLDNLLGAEALPKPVRELIIGKAEGNPFYLEEVIRSLIDGEAITRSADNGRWVAAAGLDKIKLPDSLQGVIMARIDQLDPNTKRTLQVASVIGRNFPYEVLVQVIERNKT
jgi:predicted ATPase